MKKHSHKVAKQSGFSLVELMVALTLGLLLTSAIGALFYNNKQNYNQNSLIAELQDNARFATEALSRDLEMAGFFGGILDVTQIQGDALPAITGDCGTVDADGNVGPWAFRTDAVEFLNDVTASEAAGTYNCLNINNVLPGTDILTIRRVSGQATAQVTTASAAPTLSANQLYLRGNGTVGALFFSDATATSPNGVIPTAPPLSYWEYYSRLYFVSPSTIDLATGASSGDGVPTLYRGFVSQQAAPQIRFEPLAEGVEDMQIAFGIDINGDGVVNQYKSDPTEDEVDRAITARIQLLVRSVKPDFSYTNTKSYNIFGKDDDGAQIDEFNENPPEFDGTPKDDNFYRRIANTTVILRNPTLVRGITP